MTVIEEAVRSMTRHGTNGGGKWDPAKVYVTYALRPDKESPLEIIYWGTATETDAQYAHIVVYHGGIYVRPKSLRMGTLGFRAV